MDLELKPYAALGPIYLGMDPGQVAELLGPATRQRKLPSGKIREVREINMPSIIYKDLKVVEIEVFPDVGNPSYNNLRFFSRDIEAMWESLILKDSQIFEGAGVFIFFGLGISTTLFNRVETPSLCAFAKGNWDDYLHLLKPVSLPRNIILNFKD